MSRTKTNPWDRTPPVRRPRPGHPDPSAAGELHVGKAIISIALDHATPFARSFTERNLVDMVYKLTAGSVSFKAGITPGQWGGIERSAHVEIVNASHWVVNWAQFVARSRGIATKLCRALRQETVLLEFISQADGYRAETYTDSGIAKKRRRALKAGIRGGAVLNPRPRPRPSCARCARAFGRGGPSGYVREHRKGARKQWLCGRCFQDAIRAAVAADPSWGADRS